MIKDPTMNYFAVYACSYNMFLYHVLIYLAYVWKYRKKQQLRNNKMKQWK